MREHDAFITAGEVRLRVRVAGDGPAIVFVHGWALDREMWTPQLAEFSTDHRAIAYDRRGFGRSSGAPSIAADVADLCLLLDRLDIAAAALVGMSQGARVVTRFAQRYSHRVRWLVLDGPPSLTDDRSSADIPLEDLRRRAQDEGVDAFRRAWLAHPLMQLQTDDEHIRTLVRSIVSRYPAHDLLAGFEPSDESFSPTDLAVPMLVVNGAFDSPSRLNAAERIAQLVSGAARAIVPNAGHLANLDNPAEYNMTLRTFESTVDRCAQDRASTQNHFRDQRT